MSPRKLSPTAHASARKQRLQLLCAVVLVVVGCALVILGFFVPPTGEIHPSVLVAFGEILTFVGALFGIDYHYRFLHSQNE